MLLPLLAAHPLTPRALLTRLERDHAHDLNVVRALLTNPSATPDDITRILARAAATYWDVSREVVAALSRPNLSIQTGRAIVATALRAQKHFATDPNRPHPLWRFDALPETVPAPVVRRLLAQFVATADTGIIQLHLIELLRHPHLPRATRDTVLQLATELPLTASRRTPGAALAVGCALLQTPGHAEEAVRRARQAGWPDGDVELLQVVADAHKRGAPLSVEQYASTVNTRLGPLSFETVAGIAVATAHPDWVTAALAHPALTGGTDEQSAMRGTQLEVILEQLCPFRHLPTHLTAPLLYALDSAHLPLVAAQTRFLDTATTDEFNAYLAKTEHQQVHAYAMRRLDHTPRNIERCIMLTRVERASLWAWVTLHPNAPRDIRNTGHAAGDHNTAALTIQDARRRLGAAGAGAVVPVRLPRSLTLLSPTRQPQPAVTAYVNAYLSQALPTLTTEEQSATLLALHEQFQGTIGELFETARFVNS